MKISAVILAGGKAQRLGGVNKALLQFGPARFIDRAMAAVARCEPVLVAVGQSSFELPGRAVAVFDLAAPYAGPLAGLAAAVSTLGRDVDALLSLAVDTPLFPHDFASRARPLLTASRAVVAAYAGQLYPTNALWRLEAIRDLPDRVIAGTAPHSLKHLAAELGAIPLDYADWADTDPFRNANTPEDLAFLREAGGMPQTD